MLVALQEIARLGFWSLNTLQSCYILTGLKPRPLAAMGMWDGIETGEYTRSFWAERFHISVPDELRDLLFPWVCELNMEHQHKYRHSKWIYFANTCHFMY